MRNTSSPTSGLNKVKVKRFINFRAQLPNSTLTYCSYLSYAQWRDFCQSPLVLPLINIMMFWFSFPLEEDVKHRSWRTRSTDSPQQSETACSFRICTWSCGWCLDYFRVNPSNIKFQSCLILIQLWIGPELKRFSECFWYYRRNPSVCQEQN